ncbi:hypothetical protein KTT_19550 [Tengunoibacter tsumagoiensis]|uniref:Uncharacterized protein n=2 Tax=Tengunoibacter tsumagoiensis TaxID=2014871 RepID=A0A401ZZ13_9CHLR|nr:hypothetical protein KTT_19550 [Tengunoibacter tsumagoiensis]
MVKRDTKPLSGSLWWERKGMLGWWLNLTAAIRPTDMSELATREYIRKSELLSLVIVGICGFVLALTSNSLSDPSTLLAAILLLITSVICLIFNRCNKPQIAAYIITIFTCLIIMLSIVLAKGGLRMTWIVTYDLLTVPILMAALIIHRNVALVFAFICDIFVVLDFFLHPRAHIMVHGFAFDEIQWEIDQPFFNPWAMINRNFLLLLFVGILAWMAAYSFEKALLWAEQIKQEALAAQDRAFENEQVAGLVSTFLTEVMNVFTEQANGRTVYLAVRSSQDDPFAPYTHLVNERLRRFDQLRKKGSWQDVQVTEASKALSNILHKIAVRSLPIQALAPSHFRTGIEIVDELANQMYILLYHQSQSQFVTPPPQPARQPDGYLQ